MAVALQTSLQAPLSRTQAAPWRPRSSGGRVDRCRWAPSPLLPPPLLPPLVAAGPAVVCSAGSAGQPADPQPDEEPQQPFSWAGIFRPVVVALLSPILFPLYILLVDPPELEEARGKPWSKPEQRVSQAVLVQFVFHLVALAVLALGVEVLGRFPGPAWAEAAANTLLGNGRVGEVLTACSMLSVPRSPTMQLCTLLAIFCFYRCIYHFEAWHASYFRDPPGENESPSTRSARLAVQRMFYWPRGRALWSVFVLVFMSGLPKLLRSWIVNG